MDETKQNAISSPNETSSTIHYLPCSIEHDGPLPVNSFFQVQSTKTGLVASLRGRELVGKVMSLPSGVVGLNIVQGGATSKTELSWDCSGHFKEITVWQHDVAPDLGQVQDCMSWFDIAEKVSCTLTVSPCLYNNKSTHLRYNSSIVRSVHVKLRELACQAYATGVQLPVSFPAWAKRMVEGKVRPGAHN